MDGYLAASFMALAWFVAECQRRSFGWALTAAAFAIFYLLVSVGLA